MLATIPLRQRLFIGGALLVFAALAWGYLALRAMGMNMSDATNMDMEQPVLLVEGLLFLGMWTTMMVAMMFPSVAPMLYAFAAVHRSRREHGAEYVPTWVFLSGYLLIWAAVGIPGFAASVGLRELGQIFPNLRSYAPLALGGVIVAAGIYQLSPLKKACLSQCRTPLGFVLTNWREGFGGALRMGANHGMYCLGCCWALFAVMLVVGIMNLAWMGVLALLIFVEKIAPQGVLISRISSVLLLAAGVVTALGVL